MSKRSHKRKLSHIYNRAVYTDDGKPEHQFRFHVPPGILSKRMSALEIATYVTQHLVGIIGLGWLSKWPEVEAELKLMTTMLLTSPKAALDRMLPWIRVEIGEQEDDIICLNLRDKRPIPVGVTYSIPDTVTV